MQSRVAIPSAMAGWLLVTSAASGGGVGVGTAFTFQGLLSQSGTEVTDACDFEFRAFDAATNGVQVGPTLTFDGVGANPQPPDVVDGLFTVDLDFGAGVFDGNPRFLEIAVRCPSGAGSYTTLEPRQPISPAPYAIRATQADSAANLVVPLTLSLDDSGQTTLTVENAASGGEALEVLGNLRVGPLGQFQVDSASGNVAAQGTVTADNLEATSNAQVAGDLDVGGGAVVSGVTFLEDRLDMTGNPIEAIGSLGSKFTATGALEAADDVTVGLNTVVLEAATGNGSLDGNLNVKGSTTLGDNALNDTVRVASRLEVAPNPVAVPTAFIDGATGNANIGGSLAVDGAFFDSLNNSPGGNNFVLRSDNGVGTKWTPLIDDNIDANNFVITNIGANGSAFDPNGGLDLNGTLTISSATEPVFTVERGVEEVTTVWPLRLRSTLRDTTSDSPGDPGQVLLSTGDGVEWDDLRVLGEGVVIPSEADPKFEVGSDGTTNIKASVTVDVTGGGGLRGGMHALVGSADTGTAVTGASISGIGVRGSSGGALAAGVEALGTQGAAALRAHATFGSDAIDVLSSARIGSMEGNSAGGSGALRINNVGAGHTLVVVGGDGMHVQNAYFDSADSPGASGQLLSSTGDGTQWIDCDCQGGGGGTTCVTCTDDDAHFGGDVEVDGTLTTNAPINATGSFNSITNIVTDLLQVSPPSNPFSPVVQVTATSDFAPMVRFFNFNGAAVAVQIIGDTEFQGSVGLDVSDPQHPIDHSSGAHLSDAGVFNNASSRRLKEDFQSINNREVLDRLHDLPITRWKYKTDSPQVAHLGPTAEDFREAFGLGTGDETIGTVDADGVALAAIQGLYDIVKEKETEISALNERLARLEAALAGQVRTDDN